VSLALGVFSPVVVSSLSCVLVGVAVLLMLLGCTGVPSPSFTSVRGAG
jgi:hypothetical protein